jgi:hypothetical protein
MINIFTDCKKKRESDESIKIPEFMESRKRKYKDVDF